MWVERVLGEVDCRLKTSLGEMLSRDRGNGEWGILLSLVLTAEKGDGSSKLDSELSCIKWVRCRHYCLTVSLAEEPAGWAESRRI
jgi:hypothetical protein